MIATTLSHSFFFDPFLQPFRSILVHNSLKKLFMKYVMRKNGTSGKIFPIDYMKWLPFVVFCFSSPFISCQGSSRLLSYNFVWLLVTDTIILAISWKSNNFSQWFRSICHSLPSATQSSRNIATKEYPET